MIGSLERWPVVGDGGDADAVLKLCSADGHREGDRARQAAARVFLSLLIEPGDRVMGALVAASGAVPIAEWLDRQARDVAFAGSADSAATREQGAAVVGHEPLQRGLARWLPRLHQPTRLLDAVRAAENVRATLVVPGDRNWPVGMDALGDHAPLVLWVRGSADLLRGLSAGVSLVGARASSSYGDHVTATLSGGASERGIAVVSGGAYGIDGAAHRAALATEGGTAAFLAGGIDRLYPAGHTELLRRIIERGAVVSELPCGVAPSRWRFLQRNRLIAAATAGTIVVEAGWRSGSLNTAGHAAALGRSLGAVPGPVTSPLSAGCHRLMREFNATPICDVADLLELINAERFRMPDESAADSASISPGGQSHPQPVSGRARQQAQVNELLGDAISARLWDALRLRHALGSDEIARRCGLSIAETQAALANLEVMNLATYDQGKWLRRSPVVA